jgi:hypothetical protein
MDVRYAPILLACVLACSAEISSEGDPTSDAGGNTADGGSAPGGGGSDAVGCACDSNAFDTPSCFCEHVPLRGCGTEATVDDVLQPTCDGTGFQLIHPLSEDCPIGAAVHPWDDLIYAEYTYFFNLQGELVGMTYETDQGICDPGDSLDTGASWGITTPSCERCDPCGATPGVPACP